MFKSPHREDRAQATNQADSPEGSDQDCPREDQDDCKLRYNDERHNFSDRAEADEQVPSAGWHEVYFSMGVEQR